MSTVPWQLVAVEDAELSTINLKLGATLLGRGQRATPGLDDDSISRIAARIQVDPRRIQFTSMAHPGFLRITSADSGVAKKLVRGQAVLLAMGDMIDLACSTELCAPASRFTYMLAEHIPDSDIQVKLLCKQDACKHTHLRHTTSSSAYTSYQLQAAVIGSADHITLKHMLHSMAASDYT